jgi:hypothetical protein
MMKLEWVWGLHFGANEEKEGRLRAWGYLIPHNLGSFRNLFIRHTHGRYACRYLVPTCIFGAYAFCFLFYILFWVDESICLYIQRVSMFLLCRGMGISAFSVSQEKRAGIIDLMSLACVYICCRC